MNPAQLKQDFEPTSPLGPPFECFTLPGSDLRYPQDPASTIEGQPQVPPVLTLYPGPTSSIFNSSAAYPTDPSGPQIYTGASHSLPSNPAVLRRFASSYDSANPPIGMAHAHASRSTALPIPSSRELREIYSPTTPTYARRPHEPRSAGNYNGNLVRRNHISSPTTTNSQIFSPSRMEQSYVNKNLSVPELDPLVTFGSLCYMDGTPKGTPIKFDIIGVIDKGFFLADGEWTCYRRNYFSCNCAYTMSPPPPQHAWATTVPIQLTQESTGRTFTVCGFAMSISAIVAESESQPIELVQHTPKRDKGPTSAPDKIRLAPKPIQTHHHHHHHPQLGLFHPVAGDVSRGHYDSSGYGQQQHAPPTAVEHTFERIQFKQATANNGKRRAQQQYYHLIIELWADVGGNQNEQWVKVAQKKSAKMIVRGRSPGHYQSERRGSNTSGGNAGAGLGYGSGGIMGTSDFTSGGAGILSSNFSGHATYDTRGSSQYSHNRHGSQDAGVESVMSEDSKPVHDSKDYQYYPASIYEHGPHVEMFQHPNRDQQHASNSSDAHGSDHISRSVKHEYDGSLPSIYYPGTSWNSSSGQCGRYDSKHTSNGFYPVSASSGLNIT
ncbi:hypothetical protein MCOR12_003049 [Pyricularia oryzae]|nr:hypothetical protein MCOR11_002879 [Pyricularia oryzae]KAI6603498.1 hypothetical protein MCOR12_003049 [Pyricularia oryzae]